MEERLKSEGQGEEKRVQRKTGLGISERGITLLTQYLGYFEL